MTTRSMTDTLGQMRVGLTVLSVLPSACAADVAVRSDGVLHAREHLGRMVREQQLPGAQYVAVSADRTLLDVQVGVADVATGERMHAATLQMAYSVTKAVTAIAVMQLAGAGRVDLDAPLSRYVPSHPYGPTVTVRSLLAHTSGVPNPLPLDWFVLQGEPPDREAALRRVLREHAELDDPAGEAYGYSNIGYWLLEKVIEAASGQDYGRYVEQHVFAPLGVPASALSFDAIEGRPNATGHSRRFSPMNLLLHLMTPSRYWADPHRQWSRTARVQPLGRGYGGLFCSASALAPVLQDLLREEPRLLSARARDRMFTEERTSDGKPTGSTLGFVIGELDGVRYFGKQGGGLGFHGNVRIYPQLGLATVLLANRTEISPGPIDARSNALDAGFVAELRRTQQQPRP
jgi:D-alanyl-D-alanine carboxypeptidase